MEFPTDPLTMAEMTADTALGPLELLEQCEEEGVTFEDVIEDYAMSANNTKPAVTEETETTDGKLPLLNKKPDNCIGVLHMTTGLHALLQDEAERLRKSQVSNLWWIATFADGYQDGQGRLPRSAKQYKSIEDNAGRLLANQVAIDTLAAAGYNADHLLATDLYADLDQKARVRDVSRKAQEDNAKVAQKSRMETVAKAAAGRYGFDI